MLDIITSLNFVSTSAASETCSNKAVALATITWSCVALSVKSTSSQKVGRSFPFYYPAAVLLGEFSVFSYGTSSSISGKTMEQIKSLNSCTSASALTAGTEKSLSLSSVKSKAVSWLRSVSPETGIPYFWVLTSWGLLGGLRRAFVGRWQLPSCRVM